MYYLKQHIMAATKKPAEATSRISGFTLSKYSEPTNNAYFESHKSEPWPLFKKGCTKRPWKLCLCSPSKNPESLRKAFLHPAPHHPPLLEVSRLSPEGKSTLPPQLLTAELGCHSKIHSHGVVSFEGSLAEVWAPLCCKRGDLEQR